MMRALQDVHKESLHGRACRSTVQLHVLTGEPVRCDLLHSDNVMGRTILLGRSDTSILRTCGKQGD